MSFKAVIFDLDGTLVNSLEDLADSMNIVLNKNRFPSHDYETYRNFIGKGLRHLVAKALPEINRTDELINKCLDAMRHEYDKNCITKTKPYNGIAELLKELATLNIKIAVLSNKADDFTNKIVCKLFPNIIFTAIIGFKNEESRKPNPINAILISEISGIPTDEILFVGDSDIDMKTAYNAGMYSVGVLWGFRTAYELKGAGARQVIQKPSELLHIITHN